MIKILCYPVPKFYICTVSNSIRSQNMNFTVCAIWAASHENFFNFVFVSFHKSFWQKTTAYLWLDLSKYLSCREVLTKMGCFPAGWTIVSIRECPLIKFKWLSDNSFDFPLQRPGLGLGTSRTGNQLQSEAFWPLKSPSSKAFLISDSLKKIKTLDLKTGKILGRKTLKLGIFSNNFQKILPISIPQCLPNFCI